MSRPLFCLLFIPFLFFPHILPIIMVLIKRHSTHHITYFPKELCVWRAAETRRPSIIVRVYFCLSGPYVSADAIHYIWTLKSKNKVFFSSVMMYLSNLRIEALGNVIQSVSPRLKAIGSVHHRVDERIIPNQSIKAGINCWPFVAVESVELNLRCREIELQRICLNVSGEGVVRPSMASISL